jgi:hypothetical protein
MLKAADFTLNCDFISQYFRKYLKINRKWSHPLNYSDHLFVLNMDSLEITT